MRFKRVSCSRYFAADTQARWEVVTPSISMELHDFIVVDSEESGKTEAISDENLVTADRTIKRKLTLQDINRTRKNAKQSGCFAIIVVR